MTPILPALAGMLALAGPLASPPSSPLASQMEKRERELFERRAFEQQAPALETLAPDLCLEGLDGRPWSLGQRLGKTVVLVKASFT